MPPLGIILASCDAAHPEKATNLGSFPLNWSWDQACWSRRPRTAFVSCFCAPQSPSQHTARWSIYSHRHRPPWSKWICRCRPLRMKACHQAVSCSLESGCCLPWKWDQASHQLQEMVSDPTLRIPPWRLLDSAEWHFLWAGLGPRRE